MHQKQADYNDDEVVVDLNAITNSLHFLCSFLCSLGHKILVSMKKIYCFTVFPLKINIFLFSQPIFEGVPILEVFLILEVVLILFNVEFFSKSNKLINFWL